MLLKMNRDKSSLARELEEGFSIREARKRSRLRFHNDRQNAE